MTSSAIGLIGFKLQIKGPKSGVHTRMFWFGLLFFRLGGTFFLGFPKQPSFLQRLPGGDADAGAG
jgi:hypothetical protein